MRELRGIESESPRPGADLKEFYISRLERLIRLRRDFERDLNSLGVRLLDRSIYATFRDCVDSGGSRKARVLMDGLRAALEGRGS